MREQRRFPRVSNNVDGLLKHEKTNFNCRLENISLSGALVSLRDSSTEMIHLGDTFCLRIGREGAGCSIAIRTRVAHIEFSLLGLAFLDLDDMCKISIEKIIARAKPGQVL